MLDARFGYLASHTLSYFDALSLGSPFGDQAGNIGARRNIASFFQGLDMQADRNFTHYPSIRSISACPHGVSRAEVPNQQGNIRGADAGDSASLANCCWPDACEFLAALVAQTLE